MVLASVMVMVPSAPVLPLPPPAVRVIVASPAPVRLPPSTRIEPPFGVRMVTGSLKVMASMMIAWTPSDRPMVILAALLVSAATSATDSAKVPDAPPIPIDVVVVAGCNVIAPVVVIVLIEVLSTTTSAVMVIAPAPVAMVPAVWVKVPPDPVPAVKVSAVLVDNDVMLPAMVMSPLDPPIRNTMGSRKVSAPIVISAVLSVRPIVMELKLSVSRPSSVVLKAKPALTPERLTASSVALGCNVSAPDEVMKPPTSTSRSAVIEMAPEVDAMSSAASSVVSIASTPESVSVTSPEPSAVMSSFSVRLPNVSAISIAALLPVPV